MESSSASSSTAPPHRPASLLFDKTTTDVPPLPQLEHQQPEHGSPLSTPSPTTASPTSVMFPELAEDDAIVVDAGNDDDHDHEGSPVDDDALVRSPAALSTVFPTSPSLGEQAPASPVKPGPSPLQRSLSQLSSLSLSTRSLAQSQQPQQILLSPSSIVAPSLTLSPSRRSTSGSSTPSPSTQPRPRLQPSAAETAPVSTSLAPPPNTRATTVSPAPSGPQNATVTAPSSSQAAGNLGPSTKGRADEEDEKEVEETLNTTLTSSIDGDALKTSTGAGASSAVVVDAVKREEQGEEEEMSLPDALAPIKLEEVDVAGSTEEDKQVGGAATFKGKGKERAKPDSSVAGSDAAGPSSSSPRTIKFSGSRMARKSAQHQHSSRQSYASPDPFYNPNSTTNVYINGLPPFFTHEQLTRLASEFGK
ncbi:hypothetical protein FRC01_012732, partial [Tulasnella sp. 417]